LKIGKVKVGISVFQFADDTMFFYKANIYNIITIKSISRCFEMKSSLKVNLYKSKLGGSRVGLMKLQIFFAILNCTIMNISFKYLRVLIGRNHSRKFFGKTW